MDIEGTTTPISFVHRVLFPYARARLAAFLDAHGEDPAVRACLGQAQQTVRAEEGRELPPSEAAGLLERWSDADRKHPALKALQGMIWAAGYAAGAFVGEVYDDVPPCLSAWHQAGLRLGIYSSGSVQAQKLLFAHTRGGDLTPLLSDYFDTAVGTKQAPAAYAAILTSLGRPAPAVAFLSDVAEELDAAAASGLRTVQLVRPGTAPTDRHQTAPDFAAVSALLAGRP